MTEKIYHINRLKYYRRPQVASLQQAYHTNRSACQGCALRPIVDDDVEDFHCPEVNDDRFHQDNQPLKCQDYEPDERSWNEDDQKYSDYDITKDFIFIRATKQGIVDYVAHILEHS